MQTQLSRCVGSGGGEGGDGGRQGLVGRSVQMVSRGAGAVQSWITPAATTTALSGSSGNTRYDHVDRSNMEITWLLSLRAR